MLCKYIFSSIPNLKCIPSDRQMYPWEYMYPRLGTSGTEDQNMMSCAALKTAT